MQSVSGGYVDGTEDDSDVVLSAAVSGDTASVAFSATDSDTTPETLSKTGALGSVAYHEKLSDAMSALTLADSDRFGYGVARRGDVVAVGATGAGSGSYQGAVYLIADGDGDGSFADAVSNDITEIGGSTAGITLADSDNFGSSVALGDDVLVVGARKKSTYKGAVYVIANGGDDWGSIEAGDVVKIDGDTAGITLANYDYFGDGVALVETADGTPVLAVGAGGDDTGGTGRGAVYLIDGGTDKSFATIASGDVTKISSSTGGITLANSNEFGASVALAVDTDTGNASGLVLAVGAIGSDTVYLLRDKNNDGDYADTGENTVLSNATAGISVGSNDELGRSVAVAGNLLAIGYSGDIGGGNPHGGFYLVDGGDDRWGSVVAADVVQITEYANSNTLGFSLAFDGGALIAGAMRESSDKGAAYLYDPMFTAQLATGDFEKGVSATNKLAEGTVTVSATPTDAAGNVGAAVTGSFIYDQTLPTIASAVYSGSTITLVMSESVAVSGTKTGADFTVTGGGAPTVSSYTISGSAITLSLSAAIPDGSTVTLAYAKNSTAANRIADAAGNELAAVSSQSVTNKSVSISAVSTDDYINATEDNSAVLIAGTSAGLVNGTSVTVTVDDSDADLTADYTFTASVTTGGAWTTATTDLTAARLRRWTRAT